MNWNIQRTGNVLIGITIIACVTGCARKNIPGRVEQLKAEREQALHSKETTTVTHEKHHKKKISESGDNTGKTKVVTRDSTKYYDANYANYIYYQLADSYADTIKAEPDKDGDISYAKNFVGSVNFNMRKPQYVIIHHTSQGSVDETLRTFTLERTQVSAHYLIGRDGKVYHLVNDYLRAWHAGLGKWDNITDMNSCSIGIELDNDGYAPFTNEQINSLLDVLTNLKQRFNIPTANFIGHGDFAPERKNDPNVNFPWRLLSDHGFGLWWSDTTGVQVPAEFNEYLALHIVGYDVKDAAKAIIAFRRHFCGIESSSPTLSPAEQKVLYCLYLKYM